MKLPVQAKPISRDSLGKTYLGFKAVISPSGTCYHAGGRSAEGGPDVTVRTCCRNVGNEYEDPITGRVSCQQVQNAIIRRNIRRGGLF